MGTTTFFLMTPTVWDAASVRHQLASDALVTGGSVACGAGLEKTRKRLTTHD